MKSIELRENRLNYKKILLLAFLIAFERCLRISGQRPIPYSNVWRSPDKHQYEGFDSNPLISSDMDGGPEASKFPITIENFPNQYEDIIREDENPRPQVFLETSSEIKEHSGRALENSEGSSKQGSFDFDSKQSNSHQVFSKAQKSLVASLNELENAASKVTRGLKFLEEGFQKISQIDEKGVQILNLLKQNSDLYYEHVNQELRNEKKLNKLQTQQRIHELGNVKV